MQLRYSLAAMALLATAAMAEDYISVNYMYYDEESGRTTVSTPSVEINKDFGADYSVNLSLTHDSVSGASPTYYDAFSGASAKLPKGTLYKNDIVYDDIPYRDKRKAVALSVTKRFSSRDELTLSTNYSDEYDYTAKEFSAQYLHYLDSSKNRALTLGTSYQDNDISVYCNLDNTLCDTASGASSVTKNLKVITTEIGFTQVLNKTSVLKSSLFYIDEDGYLTNPYMHVVRNYDTDPKITQERKPNSRKAYGLTLEYSKSITEKVSLLTNYRFYDDDWDITSHTLGSELYYEATPKLTVGGGIRLYTQSAASFYSGKKGHFTDQKYASSDRRVSSFESYDYSATLSYKIRTNITLTLSGAYYDQPDYFDAIYYQAGIKYGF